MKYEPAWQARALNQLSRFFEQEPDAKAFILSGSLVGVDSEADSWSDVDAEIVIADHALDRYYSSIEWLAPFGQLIGAERHESYLTKTLRVCLENFHRFDLTFIAESALQEPAPEKVKLFSPSYVVIWSRMPGLEARLDSLLLPTEYEGISPEALEITVNEFWFKAAMAIVKIIRNDLLIGFHLALDLARDGLMLQMIRRDREKKTAIHRIGAWGNELVTRFSWNSNEHTCEEILDFVKKCCEVFDELASDLLPGYEYRAPLLFPALERAQQICHVRFEAGQ